MGRYSHINELALPRVPRAGPMGGMSGPLKAFSGPPCFSITLTLRFSAISAPLFLKFVYLQDESDADVQPDASATPQGHGGARRKPDYLPLTKAARARFDTLAAESIEAVFQ